MKAEFTVIVERQRGNGVIARIAEVPGVIATAPTANKAKSQVANCLMRYFDQQRTAALEGARQQATVGTVKVETQPRKRIAKKRRKSKYDLSLLKILKEQGRIDRIPSEEEMDEMVRNFKPVAIEGRPISEEIIEDRR